MLRGRATCALAVLVVTFASADAFGEESVETLQKQQQDELAALSTQDCVIACKALASIRRAADRICALESGPRCIDARAKADDAQRRVQAGHERLSPLDGLRESVACERVFHTVAHTGEVALAFEHLFE